MKQKKVDAYQPKYPKRLLKGAILTTAAAVALAGTVGCDILRTGGMPEPMPTDELVLDGEVGYEDSDLLLGGETMPAEEEISEEGPSLMGDVRICDNP